MTCSSCGGELAAGAARCPACEAKLTPRVEGALATDPKLVTPAARPRERADATGALSRQPAILRRREAREAREQQERETAEPSWQAEVQARVRSRRQKRVGGELPLFEQPALSPPPAEAVASRPLPRLRRVPVTPTVEPPRFAPVPPPADLAPELRLRPAPAQEAKTAAATQPAARGQALSAGLTDAELADLPLRTTVPVPVVDNDFFAGAVIAEAPAASRLIEPPPGAAADPLVVHSDPDDGLELEAPPSEPAPLERPARALERTQAAAFDLALFTAVSAVAVYFASRAARVGLIALAPSWPWIAAFLTLLAVFYACYFTGTTGQTPGKLLLGLRVVDTGGFRPSYPVATARALLGLAGIALCGLGLLPMAFDPAGRALHDRAFHTRVVRR